MKIFCCCSELNLICVNIIDFSNFWDSVQLKKKMHKRNLKLKRVQIFFTIKIFFNVFVRIFTFLICIMEFYNTEKTVYLNSPLLLQSYLK